MTNSFQPAVRGVLLVCLVYHNHHEVLKYLKHVKLLNRTGAIKCIIVENTPGHTAEDNDWLYGDRDLSSNDFALVGAGENLGYFGGMKYGLNCGKQIFGEFYDWIILSNTDLVIRSENFIELLQKNDQDYIAAIAPRIVSDLTGADQNPMYISKPSRLKFKTLAFIYSHYWLALTQRAISILKKKIAKKNNLSKAHSQEFIYAAQGSFICLSKRYLDAGGTLNYPKFLFCEEIFLAEEIARIGMKIRFCPEILIHHKEHTSTGAFPNKIMVKYLAESHAYCSDVLYK